MVPVEAVGHCGEYRQLTVRLKRKIEEQQLIMQLIIMVHAMVGPEMMNDNFPTDEYVENVAEKIEQLQTGVSPVLPQRNVVPSIHIRCRMTASLRATATFARLRPRRLATSSPQRLSAEKRVTRESKTFAAS